MRFLALIAFVAAFAALILIVRDAVAAEPPVRPAIVEGRDATTWRKIALERDRTARAQARTIRRLRRDLAEPLSPARVICVVFGSDCPAALQVAWCESKLDPRARNGQYRGVFQMGRRERERYGHGSSVLVQALAAHAYYLDAGWRPWECRP